MGKKWEVNKIDSTEWEDLKDWINTENAWTCIIFHFDWNFTRISSTRSANYLSSITRLQKTKKQNSLILQVIASANIWISKIHQYLDEMSSSVISSEIWSGRDPSGSSSPSNSVNQYIIWSAFNGFHVFWKLLSIIELNYKEICILLEKKWFPMY